MDYEYTKSYYRLIVVGLSRQKELDLDPKAIQQIEFFGLFENLDCVNGDGRQSMTPLVTMVSASAMNGANQRKIHGRGVARARKGINLVILNEDMDDIRIIKKH